ncbi:PTS transporter subunit EIIC [Paenibacillus brasilensis]|uniref:Fructose-specific phosphotransferase system IIC component n=1 Tax=Paenibacillus brasilensis TaxID=128574 RepID=A0ABU0KSF6_9BACL|nr:fructose-specific phosphotransferase system IIC component [Paenibacillus brasilensis]
MNKRQTEIFRKLLTESNRLWLVQDLADQTDCSEKTIRNDLKVIEEYIAKHSPDGSFWKVIQNIGSASFTFMVPILAGFIAMSIADRPGLAPGMIGGFIAANGSFYGSEAGAGFIGGIIAGFLAGYVALGIRKIKVGRALQPIMPIIIIPVLSSLIVGLIFVL